MLISGIRCCLLLKSIAVKDAEVRCLIDLFVPCEGKFSIKTMETELNNTVVTLDGTAHRYPSRTWMGACFDGVRSGLKQMGKENDAYAVIMETVGRVNDRGTHWFHLASRVATLKALGWNGEMPKEFSEWEIIFWQTWPIKMDREQHMYEVEGFPV